MEQWGFLQSLAAPAHHITATQRLRHQPPREADRSNSAVLRARRTSSWPSCDFSSGSTSFSSCPSSCPPLQLLLAVGSEEAANRFDERAHMMHAVRGRATSIDGWAQSSEPCIRLIAATVSQMRRPIIDRSMNNLKYSWIVSNSCIASSVWDRPPHSTVHWVNETQVRSLTSLESE